jgi:hypothetical protein
VSVRVHAAIPDVKNEIACALPESSVHAAHI